MPKKIAIITAIIVTLIAIGATAIYITQRKEGEEVKGQGEVTTTTEEPVVQPEEPITQPEQPTPTEPIDTSDWKTYRNEEYGFEVRYPTTYLLSNNDIERPITQSRLVVLEEVGEANYAGRRISIEVISQEEKDKTYFHLGMSELQYIEYIKSSGRKIGSVTIANRAYPVFFFVKENPGDLGDFRDTVVVIIEEKGLTLIIKSVSASALDADFRKILSTLQFTEN